MQTQTIGPMLLENELCLSIFLAEHYDFRKDSLAYPCFMLCKLLAILQYFHSSMAIEVVTDRFGVFFIQLTFSRPSPGDVRYIELKSNSK